MPKPDPEYFADLMAKALRVKAVEFLFQDVLTTLQPVRVENVDEVLEMLEDGKDKHPESYELILAFREFIAKYQSLGDQASLRLHFERHSN